MHKIFYRYELNIGTSNLFFAEKTGLGPFLHIEETELAGAKSVTPEQLSVSFEAHRRLLILSPGPNIVVRLEGNLKMVRDQRFGSFSAFNGLERIE